jgi:hypothetical protein
MHLVARLPQSPAPASSPHEAFVGVPLSVVFADGDDIAAAARGARDSIRLAPPFHVSDEDAYLVLPEDIGAEIVDILRDGDADLLAEAMRDGLLVIGTIEREGRRVELAVDASVRPEDALASTLPYAETIPLLDADTALELLNELHHVQVTMGSALVDEEGLGAMLASATYIGPSWTPPDEAARRGVTAEPTHVWSRQLPDGRLGIELALFSEYEELVALLRPAALRAMRG